LHDVVSSTEQWQELAERAAAHERAFAAWRTDHNNRMRPYREADAAWWKKYEAFRKGDGPHPGPRPEPPRDTIDMTDTFGAERRQLAEEQRELLGKLWPHVAKAAPEVEAALLGKLRATLDGKGKTAWQPVLDELQSLATTYETCRSLGQQTTERPAAPLRPHAVTPQMAFEAAWHGVPVLGTSSDGPRVTITPANTEVDPGEVREREGAAPPATMRERLVRGVRKLDTSTRPLVQRVGEGVDEGLVEQIRKNAAKQAG